MFAQQENLDRMSACSSESTMVVLMNATIFISFFVSIFIGF